MPSAIKANTSRFFLGAALNGAAFSSDDLTDGETDSGSGASVIIGYGFTPRFALFLDFAAATIDAEDDYTLAHFDVGARYNFTNPAKALVPFVEVAFGGRAAGQDNVQLCDTSGCTTGDLSVSGTSFSFGGGLHYFVNPQLALTGNIRWSTGEFNEVTFDNVSVNDLEIDALSTRVKLGITWFPTGGRK